MTDGIDGKQARRTATSTPLGELFDHGVDSFSAALIPMLMFSIFGSIGPLRLHFITWNVFLNFYLTHFEKYNTGVLYLPWAYDFTMWVRIPHIHFISDLKQSIHDFSFTGSHNRADDYRNIWH